MTEAVMNQWESFTGPFIHFLGCGQYLVSLIVLQSYFCAHDRQEPTSQIAVALTIAVLTVFRGSGIFAATMSMWLPGI